MDVYKLFFKGGETMSDKRYVMRYNSDTQPGYYCILSQIECDCVVYYECVYYTPDDVIIKEYIASIRTTNLTNIIDKIIRGGYHNATY